MWEQLPEARERAGKKPVLRMNTFFIVGPTATGKSEIAAEVASRLGAEIVNADAFQIYRGLDLLTAKPDAATLAKAPHHLLGTVALSETMNVEKFRVAAREMLRAIHSLGKMAIVVGGSGLYVKALTHGLSQLPTANLILRDELSQSTVEELSRRFHELDPEGAKKIDHKNKRRLIRAVEVCLMSGAPFSAQRSEWEKTPALVNGVFLFWERAQLYERISRRVEKMFGAGVIDEVRGTREIGATAEKALGLREIRALIAREISEEECVGTIQRLTRQYAKRQLTWFRRQDIFEPLNLSLQGLDEAIELIAQNASSAFAPTND